MPSVLVVEDDETFAYTVRRALEAEGFEAFAAADATAALALLERRRFEVVLTDVQLVGPTGTELLRMVKERDFRCEVIVVTGFATVDLAAACVRAGAFDFLQKPVEIFQVVTSVQRAVERMALRENQAHHEKVAQAEAWYRTLFENGPVPLMVYDPVSFNYLAVNASAIRDYGYSREEFLKMKVTQIRPEEDVAKLVPVFSFEGVEPRKVGLWRHRRKDGSIMVVDVVTQDIMFAGRHARLVTCLDVTERQRTERALLESEANFRALIEQSPDHICVVKQGRLIYVNLAAVKGFGYTDASELLGRSASEFVVPEDRAQLAERLERLTGPGTSVPPKESRLLQRDGSVRFVETIGLGILFDGEPCQVGIARDITDRKQLQARLRVADRMASVGTLAAGVAHEINNPLAYVLANLSFLNDELQAPPTGATLEEIQDAVKDARSGVKRVQAIVQDLKSFSRVEEDRREPVDVHRALDSAVNLAWTQIRHRARLVKEYAAAPPLVDGNDGRLGQVFLNLLVNAAQAIPEGAAASNAITLRTGLSSDQQVFVEVTDTGSGISPEVLRRMFEPFFTTKPAGVGTGLGLSICQGIVSALGGKISAESQPGKGTTVRVLLPTSTAARQSVTAPVPAAAVDSPRGRIMVLDDEPRVGTSIQRTLRKEHDVRVFSRAREALDSLRAGEQFDLILCDLMMPELNGLQFYAELGPGDAARVVFITGGCFCQETLEQVDRLPNLRLEKLVDAKQLRQLVRERVGGGVSATDSPLAS